MIPTITLGDNLTVSKLGFGGMAVTDTYGSTPDEVAKQTRTQTHSSLFH